MYTWMKHTFLIELLIVLKLLSKKYFFLLEEKKTSLMYLHGVHMQQVQQILWLCCSTLTFQNVKFYILKCKNFFA